MISGLDRARWEVLGPCVDQALDLPEDARASWLGHLRVGDPALAAEIQHLLAAYTRIEAERFLENPPAPRATLAGQTLGAYTLREPVGRGGMGSVWRAERSDGRYEGVVAVKLMNASLIGREAESRFRREASILARLRHPHIAYLVDAGASPAGQPYLVLEHVDGEHIDAYCDRRRLGIEARVRLFLDVLAAVAHAHANLIVHRDLKPSNVLVDGAGTVKLIDFGVAKLMDRDESDAARTLTREGAALTPGYAAPEQLTGGEVTTASDVYALGVMLYELLSGRHPAMPAATVPPGELVRAILERKPSSLSSGDAACPLLGPPRDPALSRGTTPEGLRRALRGDLETIVGKALKREPAERYPSVAALAEDLRRYLEHLPVRARRDTFGRHATQFVRRNCRRVALAGALLSALMARLWGELNRRPVARSPWFRQCRLTESGGAGQPACCRRLSSGS